MKTNVLSTVIAAGFVLGGCGQDSTNKAEKANEEKIDKQAVAISSDDKDKAKDVSKGLVDLASMSMTEYELSKVAFQRATNPQVKAYAQQTMNEHQQTERELRTIARQLNVTLPTTMAKEGKDRVEDLQDNKSGTAFDVEYLSEISKVNDKAINVADELEDYAPTGAVKTFARKIQSDDKKHRDQAEQLKNVLD